MSEAVPPLPTPEMLISASFAVNHAVSPQDIDKIVRAALAAAPAAPPVPQPVATVTEEGDTFRLHRAWIPATERLPAGDARHGYSERVIVNVVCDNGVVFRDSDKYDTLSKTWDRHHTDNGRRVTDWMPMPPEPASPATEGKKHG